MFEYVSQNHLLQKSIVSQSTFKQSHQPWSTGTTSRTEKSNGTLNETKFKPMMDEITWSVSMHWLHPMVKVSVKMKATTVFNQRMRIQIINTKRAIPAKKGITWRDDDDERGRVSTFPLKGNDRKRFFEEEREGSRCDRIGEEERNCVDCAGKLLVDSNIDRYCALLFSL